MKQNNSEHSNQGNEVEDLVSRIREAVRCREKEKKAARVSQATPFSSEEEHGELLADLRDLAGTGRPTPRHQPKPHTLLRDGLVLSDQDTSWSVELPLSGTQPPYTRWVALAAIVGLTCLSLALWTLMWGRTSPTAGGSVMSFDQDELTRVQSTPAMDNSPGQLDR
jgi:hypothetical protein